MSGEWHFTIKQVEGGIGSQCGTDETAGLPPGQVVDVEGNPAKAIAITTGSSWNIGPAGVKTRGHRGFQNMACVKDVKTFYLQKLAVSQVDNLSLLGIAPM